MTPSMFLIPLVLAIAPPTVDDAALLTGFVATAAAEVEGVDVLTRADLRAALAVESDKQALGCADESCLAEIAAALDARAVLFGSIFSLDDELVLQLNLFDSGKASSAGRTVARAPSTKALAAVAEEKTRELVRSFVADRAAGSHVRILVLDLERGGKGDAGGDGVVDGNDGDAGWLMPAGIGVSALGVVGVGVGVVLDVLAVQAWNVADADRTLPASDAAAHYAQSDAMVPFAVGGYVVGGALLAGGVTLAVIGLMSDDVEPVPSSTPPPAIPAR